MEKINQPESFAQDYIYVTWQAELVRVHKKPLMDIVIDKINLIGSTVATSEDEVE
jgi:hypothetical protein